MSKQVLARSWPAVCLLSGACSLLNHPDPSDRCAERRVVCDPVASCENAGKSFRCHCPGGYEDVRGDGTRCVERDECADGSHDCDALATCANEPPGDYTCHCPEGYLAENDGRLCRDIDACAVGQHDCNLETELCVDQPGAGFECTCKRGFSRASAAGSCADIDECGQGEHACQAPAECRNEPGRYACACPEGLQRLSSTTCERIDVCQSGRHGCGEGTRCVVSNETGYTCDCLQGHARVSSNLCQDIDECQPGSNATGPCAPTETCTNSSGSFECRCRAYFDLDGDGLGCADEHFVRADARAASAPLWPLADNHGNLIFAGTFGETIELCGRSFAAQGVSDLLIVKYDAALGCQWPRTFGSSAGDEMLGATVDREGNPIVTASFEGRIELDDWAADSGSHRGRLVAKLSAADGSVIWARAFLNVDPDDPEAFVAAGALAADADGHVLWAAQIPAGVALEGATQVASGGDWDALVAKLDARDGHLVWHRIYEGAGPAFVTGVAVDTAGSVLIAGLFEGWLVDGNGMQGGIFDRWQGFVKKLNADGSAVWGILIGGSLAESQQLTRDHKLLVAATSGRDVAIGGSYYDGARIGDAAVSSAGQHDVFLAMLGENGEFAWLRSLGGSADDQFGQLAVDGSDRIAVAGAFGAAIDFGEGALASAGKRDLFVASFDAGGDLRWGQRFGGDGDERSAALAVGPSGDLWVTAQFQPPLVIGDAALPEPAGPAALVLQLRP